MQIINVHDAKIHLLRLVTAASNGEEIIIAKAGKPAARLMPLVQINAVRRFGALKGKIRISD